MSKDSIIKAFEGVNVRIVWDDEKEEYLFSVNDIVEVLTESKDPRDYIKKMLKRDPELTFQMAVQDYRRLGYSDKWITQRMRSIEVRKALTDEWDRAGVQQGQQYALLTFKYHLCPNPRFF